MQELGLVKGKMRSVLLLVSVLLLSLTVSCIVPIPQKVGTRGKITKRAVEFLEEGVTSREQVLLHRALDGPGEGDQNGPGPRAPRHRDLERDVFAHALIHPLMVVLAIGDQRHRDPAEGGLREVR